MTQVEELIGRLERKCESNGAWMTSDLREFYGELRDALASLQDRVDRLEGLISEASIERLAEDIAIACVDCRQEIREARHRAMVRLGDRLRNPMPDDTRFVAALQTKPDAKGEDSRPPEKPPISRDPPGPPAHRVA
jgi:hypothetical protein